MKTVKLLLALCSLCFFSACIDIEELIDINKDGGGNYSMTMDMGKLMEFAGAMKQDTNDKEGKKKMEKVDTTIYFKSAGNDFSKLSEEEQRVFKEGYLTVNLDEAGKKMNIKMFCPFKNMNDLTVIKKELPGLMKKLNMMDKAGKAKSNEMPNFAGQDDETDFGKLNPTGKNFSFSAAPGKLSYSINDKDKVKELAANDSVMQMMQQASLLMGDMTTTTIIKLPAPAKSVSNTKAEVSADKKTMTIRSIITDLMEKPEEGEYSIEY